MSTEPLFRYNPLTDTIEGFPYTPGDRPSLEEPSYIYILYIRGISLSWKQPVGHLNTRASPSAYLLRAIIMETAISQAHANGKLKSEKCWNGSLNL